MRTGNWAGVLPHASRRLVGPWDAGLFLSMAQNFNEINNWRKQLHYNPRISWAKWSLYPPYSEGRNGANGGMYPVESGLV